MSTGNTANVGAQYVATHWPNVLGTLASRNACNGNAQNLKRVCIQMFPTFSLGKRRYVVRR